MPGLQWWSHGGAAVSYKRGTPVGPLGPLGFEGAQHRQTLRPSVDGIRSTALRPLGVQYAARVRHSLLPSSFRLQGSSGLPQGYLANKKMPPPYDHRRVLWIGLLQGPKRRMFLMGEVPL